MSTSAANNPRVVLASASPRRTELLSAMGVPHRVLAGTVDEDRITADHPRTLALRIAYAKLGDVLPRCEQGSLVIAADTVVTRNMILYAKPANANDARRMLSALSGKTHHVITGIAIGIAGTAHTWMDAESTAVHMRDILPDEMEDYLASPEPYDKAGAYGIQGAAGAWISRIEGDYYNVVGFPCRRVASLLSEAEPSLATRIPPPPERWR